MANPKKISLSQSRDIPFDKLVLSGRNVRRVQAGVPIEELAEDIARRTLLQSLSVRPIPERSEEHTSELQSLMRISYAVFCLKKQQLNHLLTIFNPSHKSTIDHK